MRKVGLWKKDTDKLKKLIIYDNNNNNKHSCNNLYNSYIIV